MTIQPDLDSESAPKESDIELASSDLNRNPVAEFKHRVIYLTNRTRVCYTAERNNALTFSTSIDWHTSGNVLSNFYFQCQCTENILYYPYLCYQPCVIGMV